MTTNINALELERELIDYVRSCGRLSPEVKRLLSHLEVVNTWKGETTVGAEITGLNIYIKGAGNCTTKSEFIEPITEISDLFNR